MRKVTGRLAPILMALYFVSYLDRTNIAFASLTMNEELGFSPTVFGIGGSFFFVGYLALQIPGAMAVGRFGGRSVMMWMALVWGLLAAGMAFVWNAPSFYVARALLGAAESAFVPAAIFYLSLWFPAHHRARMIGLFLVANPLASALGFPLSALLMRLDGVAGLSGWQWIFVAEGLPAVALAFVAFRLLSDRPADAKWLDDEERAWLTQALGPAATSTRHSFRESVSGLAHPVALALSVGYCGIIMGIYGLNLWAPQMIRLIGFGDAHIGIASATPYVLASLAILVWALRLSRRKAMGEMAAGAALASGLALVICSFLGSPAASLVALSVAAVALYVALPAYWTMPNAIFPGVRGAAVVGLISSVGHVGGILGPALVGYLRESTGDFSAGLRGLAASLLVTVLVAWMLRKRAVT